MEEIFLWLQRTMLGMVDEEENVFVELGRKLLTVHKYVVANATTEAELARTFWAEVAELTRWAILHSTSRRMRLQIISVREQGGLVGTAMLSNI